MLLVIGEAKTDLGAFYEKLNVRNSSGVIRSPRQQFHLVSRRLYIRRKYIHHELLQTRHQTHDTQPGKP